MKHEISLRVNGDTYRVAVDPHRILADVLREDLDLTGTKVGCGTGDCGACTVLLDGRPVSSCLTLAVEADGREIFTVEGLAVSGRELHPIQRAFVDKGAIQCGFCTPGMEMSAYYLLCGNPRPTEADIRLALSGNLCRCTGYNKIIDAVSAAAKEMAPAAGSSAAGVSEGPALGAAPEAEPQAPPKTLVDGGAWSAPGYAAPGTVEEACALLAAEDGRVLLLAGGTDVMPKLKGAGPRARPRLIVGLRSIPELGALACNRETGLHIGAMVRLAHVAAHPGIRALFPAVAEAAAATGTPQIRNMGTVVGNLCNAAPSADNAPALIVLGAVLQIVGPSGRRGLPLTEFFQGPGRTVLRPGEIVTSVTAAPLPLRSGQSYQHLSERGRVDISAVSAAAVVVLDGDGSCEEVRIAVGGVAPTPLWLAEAQGILAGRVPDGAAIVEVAEAAAAAACPISDVRATAGYRRRMTRVLVERALTEATTMAQGRTPEWKDPGTRSEAKQGRPE